MTRPPPQREFLQMFGTAPLKTIRVHKRSPRAINHLQCSYWNICITWKQHKHHHSSLMLTTNCCVLTILSQIQSLISHWTVVPQPQVLGDQMYAIYFYSVRFDIIKAKSSITAYCCNYQECKATLKCIILQYSEYIVLWWYQKLIESCILQVGLIIVIVDMLW